MIYHFSIRRAEGNPTALLASNDPTVVTTVIDALMRLLEQVRAEVNDPEAEARWWRLVQQLEDMGDDARE